MIKRVHPNKLNQQAHEFFISFIQLLKDHICSPYAGFNKEEHGKDFSGDETLYILPPWLINTKLIELYRQLCILHKQKTIETSFTSLWK